jgi:hypothetical protein
VTLILPRLPQQQPEWPQMQVWWQQVVEAIEAQEGKQDSLIAGLAAVVADMATAQADIITALDQAGIALGTANAAARELARINSYPDPASVLTATDAGTTASIIIANHTRVYPVQGTIDVPDVAIAGATLTGLAFATKYFVYYDDATLADTTPAFLTTTDNATAQVGAAAGRHIVGVVTTPADGAADTDGDGGAPPGGVGGPIP